MDWSHIQFFKSEEFACPCCGACEMDQRFVEILDGVRFATGQPLHINSGFRCKAHNEAVGGSLNSAHTRGFAADIRVDSDAMRYEIREALTVFGVNRIGHGKGFIHIDTDPMKNFRREWTY